MQDRESAFQNSQLFSKEELLQSFKLTMEHIKDDKQSGYTEKSIKKKLELCNKFVSALEKCKLPTLTELWWFYEYEFTGTGIELHLCSADDIEFKKDNCTISSMTTSIENILLGVECDYLTVEQFADIQGVSPVTIHQWIRRGKLRNAKKRGENWVIPSLEDKPSREYEPVQYILEDAESIHIDEFPLVSACDSIWIHQDDDKTKFICYFDNYKTQFKERMILNRQEIESLELALISSGKAKPWSKVQYIPIIK